MLKKIQYITFFILTTLLFSKLSWAESPGKDVPQPPATTEERQNNTEDSALKERANRLTQAFMAHQKGKLAQSGGKHLSKKMLLEQEKILKRTLLTLLKRDDEKLNQSLESLAKGDTTSLETLLKEQFAKTEEKHKQMLQSASWPLHQLASLLLTFSPERAITLFKTVTLWNPNTRPITWFYLGNLLFEHDRKKEAESAYLSFLAKNAPNQPHTDETRHALFQTLRQLTTYYTENMRFSEAIALHEEALSHRIPQNDHKERLWHTLKVGKLAYQQGSPKKAALRLTEAILYAKEEPLALAKAFGWRGYLHLYQGDTTKAEADQQQSLKLFQQQKDPQGALWINLLEARIALFRGEFKKAEEIYQNSVERTKTLEDKNIQRQIFSEYANLYHIQDRRKDELEVLHQALAVIPLAKTPLKKAELYNLRGRIAHLKENTTEAVENFKKSLKYYQKTGYIEKIVETQQALIFVWLDQPEPSHFNQLKSHIERGRTLSQAHHFFTGETDFLALQGYLDFLQKDYQKALKKLTQAEKRDQKIQRKASGAATAFILGRIFTAIKNLEKAEAAFQRSLSFFQNKNFPQMLSMIWSSLGDLFHKTAQPEKAEHAYKQSMNQAIASGDLSQAAQNARQLSRLALEQRAFQKGERYLKQSLQWHESLNLSQEIAQDKTLLGELLLKKGEITQAENYFKESMSQLKKAQEHALLAKIYRNMAKIALTREQFNQAENWLKKSKRKSNQLNNNEERMKTYLELARLAFKQSEQKRRQAYQWVEKTTQLLQNNPNEDLSKQAEDLLQSLGHLEM
ncbi:tetratricopeptide repeat protein [Magnetococcales bacterium HHB-1]